MFGVAHAFWGSFPDQTFKNDRMVVFDPAIDHAVLPEAGIDRR
jgi:hypothetical protein